MIGKYYKIGEFYFRPEKPSKIGFRGLAFSIDDKDINIFEGHFILNKETEEISGQKFSDAKNKVLEIFKKLMI